MKRECQPDENINNIIKRDQPKPRLSKDRMKVSLTLFSRFHFLRQFNFRFNVGSCSQKRTKKGGTLLYFLLYNVMSRQCFVLSLLYFLPRFIMSRL